MSILDIFENCVRIIRVEDYVNSWELEIESYPEGRAFQGPTVIQKSKLVRMINGEREPIIPQQEDIFRYDPAKGTMVYENNETTINAQVLEAQG